MAAATAETGQDATTPDRAAPDRRIVAVVGMHRSGTSLATEILLRLGAHTREALLPANDFNARGYWEDSDVVAIHDRILSGLNRSLESWQGALPLPEGWTDQPQVTEQIQALEALVRSEFARREGKDSGPWVIKDPRICRLLPLWRRICETNGIALSAVLCVRTPDAVAASLNKRDRLPAGFGRLVWLVNLLDALRDGGDLIGGCVSYDQWFSNAAWQITTLSRVSGLAVSDSEMEAITSEVITDTLRHHGGTRQQGIADRLYGELDQWAATGVRPEDLDRQIGQIGAMITDIASLVVPSGEADPMRAALETRVEEFRLAYQDSARRCAELEALAERYRLAFEAADSGRYEERCRELESLIWRFEPPLRWLRSLRRIVHRLRKR